MSFCLSIVLEHLGFLDSDVPGLPVHGANLSVAQMLRRFVSLPDIAWLEVFLPPAQMVNQDALRSAAHSLLPPDMRGKDALRFIPVHSLPETWSDRHRRVLFSIDIDRMPRDRYLRDTFATCPTPLTVDTHAFGPQRYWPILQRIADAPPAPSDSIVCLTPTLRDAVARAFSGFLLPEGSAPPCRLDVLSHGIDTELFRPATPERREDARRLLRLPRDATIALFLGRLTPNDKTDLLPLIRCFAASSGRREDVLLIAGHEDLPGYVNRLREAADGLSLGERVMLRTDVPPAFRSLYYTAADLFVHPGDALEAMGNTVLEAMASGLPVIAADWAGPRTIVENEVTGILAPAWWMPGLDRIGAFSTVNSLLTDYLYTSQMLWVDEAALTEALGGLLGNPGLRQTMGASGRQRAERCYSWPAVMTRWLELWGELLAQASSEDPAQAAERRKHANRIGLPTPYRHVFGGYGANVFDPHSHGFRLTAAGRAVNTGEQRLRFYDDILPVVRQEIVNVLFSLLDGAGSQWTQLGVLTGLVSRETGQAEDDVRFHLGLLLKLGVVEFTVLDQTSPGLAADTTAEYAAGS